MVRKHFFSTRLLRAAALGSLAIIVGMSIVPGAHRPTVEVNGLLIGALGVIEHIIGYAVCGFLFAIGFSKWRATFIFLALAALATSLEVVQFFVPERTPKVSDALFSAAGAGLGVYLPALLQTFRLKRMNG